METIKKEQEQERLNEVETTVASLTELPTSSPEISEPLEVSTLSANYEDGQVASTTPESFSEIDTTSELSLEENLLREVSDVSTIRSETTMTFDPTERSAQEENEVEKSFVTEESTQNEEISINTDTSDQRVTTEIPSSDKNVENEASVSTLKTQTSELNEESTLIDALYNEKTEDLFTTAEPRAEATEASVREDAEAETSVPEAGNLIKAAESVITSQTEAYLEENTPERSNVIETTQFYEERDVSTSDYSYVTELDEQTTELQPLEPRLSDNHETFDQVSTISNIEIAEESDGESSALLGTETPSDISSLRNVDHTSSTVLPDEIPVTTSNYESSKQGEDTDLLYVFEEDLEAQPSKSQKSESINIESENNKHDNEIVEGTTIEAESSTYGNTETTTTLNLVDREAVVPAMEETEIENLLRSDIVQNNVNDVELSTEGTSEHFTTEAYSTTILSEDTETNAADNENLSEINSARREIIEETTTTAAEIASEDGFVLAEESTTQSGELRLLDEDFISTTEKSEAAEDNWETTEIPNVSQEPKKGNENVESKIESVVEKKLENTSEKSNETDTENKIKSQETVTEKSEVAEDNWETTETPYLRQESKILTKTIPNKKEDEELESEIESVVETKSENTSEDSSESATENKVKSQENFLAESDLKTKRRPQDSNIHVFEKILSNGSVTKIETHSSEDRKQPKMDRISTQFHHLARKYGLRPLTRKTFKDDVKNRRKYRLSSRKSLFENNQ